MRKRKGFSGWERRRNSDIWYVGSTRLSICSPISLDLKTFSDEKETRRRGREKEHREMEGEGDGEGWKLHIFNFVYLFKSMWHNVIRHMSST